ncbi:hypothetical protein [Listeria sp. ILCC792]|uniref:hypothetical protein n=1 Tax=Listeria sp. ILCC792 TaxID=1918331 RepID=UPI001356341B|nr:hypothetical protein [Listeria sp. ILCC792]
MELWDAYDKNKQLLNVTLERGKTIPYGFFHFAPKFSVAQKAIIHRKFYLSWLG